jgi:hypothetical protein
MSIATGVNGTLKINDQTEKQNSSFRNRSEGNTSKGAANYDSIKTMFPNSPVHLDTLTNTDDRGGYIQEEESRSYNKIYADLIDGSVTNGYGFEGEDVNLNYNSELAPKIDAEGYVNLPNDANLSDNPPIKGTPNTTVLNRTLSSPEEVESTSTQYEANDGFGIKVEVVRSNSQKAPGDTIGKYFSNTLAARID